MSMQNDTIAAGGTGFQWPSETSWRALVPLGVHCPRTAKMGGAKYSKLKPKTKKIPIPQRP